MLVQISVLLLLAIAFFSQRATLGEWLSAIAIGAIGFIAWRTAAEGWLFWIALFVICGKGIKLKPLACITFATLFVVIVFSSCASSVGLIENKIVFRGDTGVMRNPLGFDHPNFLGAALLVACISLVPLVKGRRIVFLSVLCVFAAGISMLAADSRTSALCLGALAMMIPIYAVVKHASRGREASIILLLVLAVMVLVSFGYMAFYDQARPLDAMLNSAFSGRLQLAHTYYLDHAPGLFGYGYEDGTVFYADGEEYTFVVDNLFAHVLLRYGVIACALFLFGLFALFRKMHKEAYFGPVLLGMGLFLTYGMSETLGCRVECNFFIISLWTVLYHRPLSEFSDDADAATSVSAIPSSLEGELTFRELLVLPLNVVRSRRG